MRRQFLKVELERIETDTRSGCQLPPVRGPGRTRTGTPIPSNQENRGFSVFLPTFGRQEICKIWSGLGEILGKTQQPPGFSWLLPIPRPSRTNFGLRLFYRAGLGFIFVYTALFVA